MYGKLVLAGWPFSLPCLPIRQIYRAKKKRPGLCAPHRQHLAGLVFIWAARSDTAGDATIGTHTTRSPRTSPPSSQLISLMASLAAHMSVTIGNSASSSSALKAMSTAQTPAGQFIITMVRIPSKRAPISRGAVRGRVGYAWGPCPHLCGRRGRICAYPNDQY